MDRLTLWYLHTFWNNNQHKWYMSLLKCVMRSCAPTWLRANVVYMPNFQPFLLQNVKGNLYTLLLYKKFYIILDIIVTLIICICIVHKNCVIIHFYASCRIKAKGVEFCLLKIFCSLIRNKNIKIWFLYVTSNKGFLEFYTVKTTKQNKEYVWVLWSSWIVICLSRRHEIVIRNR